MTHSSDEDRQQSYSDSDGDLPELTDSAQLAINQAIHEARRKLEHARMIEEALQRWRETKSAREAHAAFVAKRQARTRYIY